MGITPEETNHKGESRIRCMRAVLDQIEADYAACKQLYKRWESAPSKKSTEEELLGVMCWLKQEITLYRQLKCAGIEGVSCVEIDEIEKDIRIMELNLRVIDE